MGWTCRPLVFVVGYLSVFGFVLEGWLRLFRRTCSAFRSSSVDGFAFTFIRRFVRRGSFRLSVRSPVRDALEGIERFVL